MPTKNTRPETTTTSMIVSADGTSIEVRTVGIGPGVIVIPGVRPQWAK